jgi:hypothetical protein
LITSGDELQSYNSANLNFHHEKIVSAPQNTCSEFTEVSFTQFKVNKLIATKKVAHC